VTVQVEVPRKPSREERELIEQLAQLNGKTAAPAQGEE
jgi:DnaJ-class molecular chaperone